MENKNILCLSWCDADEVMNYGQILQGCAMMYLLRENTLGRVCYISYLPRNIKSIIKYYYKHYNIFSGHCYAYLKTKKMIRKFISQNSISFHQVMSKEIPSNLYKDIEIMYCGSDQIWHPQNYNKNYFLDFGEDNVKRVSYASSLPKTKVESQFEEQFRNISEKIKKLDKISVREKRSEKFLSFLANREVANVLDPTYLVPHKVWNACIEYIAVPREYIFVYIPNEMDLDIVKMVEGFKDVLSIQNIVVMITRGENLFVGTLNLKFVSAGQFLYLIKNAKCVITSSFHAVVFSTIFHTEFYCYDVPNFKRGEDIRLVDLLEKIGLEERLLDSNSGKCEIRTKIDYQKIEKKINELKTESEEFLKGSIV